MRTTEMLLFAHFLKTSKFIPACISIYILSLGHYHFSPISLICKKKQNGHTKLAEILMLP